MFRGREEKDPAKETGATFEIGLKSGGEVFQKASEECSSGNISMILKKYVHLGC